MRLTHTLALAGLAVTSLATALPASAQAGYYGHAPAYRGPAYNDVCASGRRDNQAAGLVLGGIIGGVLGSNVAARGHRDDGTALGAVVGALAGSEIGRGAARCGSTQYGYAPPPPAPAYSGYGYDSYPASAYPPLDGGRDYGYNNRDFPRGSFGRDGEYDEYVAGGYDRTYTGRYRDDDIASRECAGAKQITKLPDGTEIHRPVEACRSAYYGDWTIED